MKNINEDIATGQFKSVYLLYGVETLLVHQYRDKLKSALVKEGDNMNVAYYEGALADVTGIIEFADTMPFFADRRVLFVNESGLFKAKKKASNSLEENEDEGESEDVSSSQLAERLSSYVKEMPESACIIFSEEKVDKRNKLYKAISQVGRAIEFGRQDAETLYTWIASRLKKDNKAIRMDACQLFVKQIGDDMQLLSRELEKLTCYAIDRDVITLDDVKAVCSVSIEDKVFDMVAAVAEHKREAALKIYDDMIALRTPPLKLMALLSKQFNKLYQVRLLKAKGATADTISVKVSLKPGYVTKLYVDRAMRFTEARLREAIEECVDLEERIKTGRINDKMAIELIIIKFSAKHDD